MCGLFGWQLSTEARKDLSLEAMVATLMLRNELRGKDSWGIIAYDGRETTIQRGVGTIVKANAIKHVMANQVLGHTRKATIGAVTERNAHPFDMGRIIGSHNGMISNHESLKTKYNRTFEVDSQHLLAHINDSLPLAEISGYGVVTYVAKEKPQEVMLGVGMQGDLAVAGIGSPEKTIGIVWSSTWTAVEDALDISGIPKFFRIQIEQGKLYRVANNDIFNHSAFKLQHAPFPSNYQGGAYESNGQRGRIISIDYSKDEDKKKLILLSKKRKKALLKSLQGLTVALIASRRGLKASPLTLVTMPSCISVASTPGYV